MERLLGFLLGASVIAGIALILWYALEDATSDYYTRQRHESYQIERESKIIGNNGKER